MDEMYENFRINIHKKLKDCVNASIYLYIDEDDNLVVDISRLAVNYVTKVKNCSHIIQDGEDGIDHCVSKIVRSYRNFINHKFFY